MTSAQEEESGATPSTGRADGEETARAAGRGGLAIVFAKVWFILVGLVQNAILPGLLGAGGFGDFRNAQSLASIFYNPVVTSSIQGGSRAVARATSAEAPGVIRRVFSVHVGLGVFFAAAFFFSAEPLAQAIKAPQITPLLRILAGVVFCYALYSPLVGILNGQRRFGRQALLDVIMACLRTAGLVGGAFIAARIMPGLLAEGAVLGFAVGSVVILVLSLAMVGVGRGGPSSLTLSAHLGFMVPVWFGQVALNLLLQADVNLLRLFAASAAERGGLTVEAASPLVGAYAATQLYCFLPYQLLLSITFVLFPMLAKAHKEGDREAMARYVRTGVRLAVVLAGAMVAVTSGLSGPLLRLLFQEEYWVAAPAMQVLTLGFGVFAIFGVFSAVLNSLGRALASMLSTLVAMALVVGLCFITLHDASFSTGLLQTTAICTSVGVLVATLIAAALVRSAAGGVVAPLSVLRVVVALFIAIAVARQLPYVNKVMTLVWSGVVVAIYALCLLVTRELKLADWHSLRAVVRRRVAPSK